MLLDRWIVGGIIGFDGVPICWKSETFRGVSLEAYCGSNRGRRGDGKGIRVLDDDVEALLNEVSGVDSMDNIDAAGDSSVVIVMFSDPGVFGCWG